MSNEELGQQCDTCKGTGGIQNYVDGLLESSEPCPRCMPIDAIEAFERIKAFIEFTLHRGRRDKEDRDSFSEDLDLIYKSILKLQCAHVWQAEQDQNGKGYQVPAAAVCMKCGIKA